jgi:hypothetical protein
MKYAVLLMAATGLMWAQTSKPLIQNERVTVWDITVPARTNMQLGAMTGHDTVIVSLDRDAGPEKDGNAGKGSGTLGQTEFRSKDAGGGIRNTKLTAARYAVIVLSDGKVPAVENKSGFPRAFPRPGIQQLEDNGRVTIWDYSWTPGAPTPVHFHDLDVTVVYLDDGALESTTPDGVKTLNDYKFADIRFNKPNRTHREEVVRGKQRAILIELK